MASMIVVKIVGVLFKIPLTNIIDVVGIGYFSQAYSIFTLFYALTVTGLSAAVARMVSENAARGRYKDVRKILKLSTIIYVALGVLGFVIVLLSAKGITKLVDMPNTYWSYVMISPAILFCCLMASYRGYYEGLSNMIPTAITQIVEVITKLIAGLAFATIAMKVAENQFTLNGIVFGVKVTSHEAATSIAIPYAAAAATLGVSVSTLIGFIYIFLRYKIKGDHITRKQLTQSPHAMRAKVLLLRLIKVAIPITLGAVVIQLSVLIDNFTIPRLLGHAYAQDPSGFNDKYAYLLKNSETVKDLLFGSFWTVVAIFNLVPAFTNIFGKSALPNVTEAWVTKDKKSIKTNIESVLRVTMLVAAPASMGIVFMARPIIELLYSKSEAAIAIGPPLLSVLGIASLLVALVTPTNAIMQGIGRMDLPVKYLAIGALTKIILNITLIGIPSINIMGASISTVVCYSIICIISLNKLKKVSGVKLDYISSILKPMICGLFCGISAFLSYKALTTVKENRIITILSILIGALVYVISLAIFNAISRDDILMLPKGKKIVKVLEKFKIIR